MFAVRHPQVLIHRFKNVWVLSNRKSLWRLWKTQKNTKKREKISSDAPALRQALPSFPAKQPPHFSQCQKTDATPHPERKAWGTISPAGLQVPGPPWRPASHRQLTWPQGLCNPNRQSLHQTRSLPPRRWAQPAPSAGFRVSRLSGEGLSPGGPALGASPRPRPVCVLVSSPGCCSRAGGRGSLHPNAEPGGSSGAPCRPRPGLPPWPATPGRGPAETAAHLVSVGTLRRRLALDSQTLRGPCSPSTQQVTQLAKVHSSVSGRLPAPQGSRRCSLHGHPPAAGPHLPRTQLRPLTLLLPPVNHPFLLPQTPGPSPAAPPSPAGPPPGPPLARRRSPAPGLVYTVLPLQLTSRPGCWSRVLASLLLPRLAACPPGPQAALASCSPGLRALAEDA